MFLKKIDEAYERLQMKHEDEEKKKYDQQLVKLEELKKCKLQLCRFKL